MPDNRETIRRRMADILDQSRDRLGDSEKLSDLITSSFLMVEMIIDLQEEFDARFGQQDMQGVETVGQLLDLYCARAGATPRNPAPTVG